MGKDLSRRQFFRLVPSRFFQSGKKRPPTDGGWLRPPGAIKDAEAFLSTCQHCQACSEACPFDVIDHFGPDAGIEEGTPFMNPALNPCRWCASMDCIHACPSGALSFNDSGEVEPVGKVTLDMDACLNRQGILCDDCAHVCPSTIKAITMEKREPKLDRELCVGCGLCVYYCGASPVAFKVDPIIP